MSKRIESFDKMIDTHQHRHIPLELGQVIQQGIRAGKNESDRRKRHLKRFMKVILGITIILAIFTVGINFSSTFNLKLKQIPVIDQLVSVFQFRETTGIHDIDTDYKDQKQNYMYVLRTELIRDSEVLNFIADALYSEYPDLEVVQEENGLGYVIIEKFTSEAEAKKAMDRLTAFMAAQKIKMKIEKTQRSEDGKS